jgi:hypothetical protein
MAPRKFVMAAFNQGAVPTIACINKATVELQHVPTGVNRDSQGAPQERV